MHPVLFSIGPLTIHTYGFLVAVGAFVGLLVAIRGSDASGISRQQILDLIFMIIISAIVGSRLAFVLMNYTFFLERPLAVFKLWEGGLVFSGGFVLVILLVGWYIRRHRLPLWTIGDLLAPAVAISQGIGRLGCLMAGCCYGKPSDMPWSLVFKHPQALAPLHVPLHPTQIYAALSGFLIFAVLMLIRKKKKFEGQVLLWFVILHSTSRLILERFRGDDRGSIPGTELSVTQAVTLLLLIAGVVFLVILSSKAEKRSSSSSSKV
jgi:phosphatidylglycerol:prolipoprotein diacylglycerol transferase